MVVRYSGCSLRDNIRNMITISLASSGYFRVVPGRDVAAWCLAGVVVNIWKSIHTRTKKVICQYTQPLGPPWNPLDPLDPLDSLGEKRLRGEMRAVTSTCGPSSILILRYTSCNVLETSILHGTHDGDAYHVCPNDRGSMCRHWSQLRPRPTHPDCAHERPNKDRMLVRA